MCRGQGGRQSSESDGLSHSYTRVGYRRTAFRLGLPETIVVHWVLLCSTDPARNVFTGLPEWNSAPGTDRGFSKRWPYEVRATAEDGNLTVRAIAHKKQTISRAMAAIATFLFLPRAVIDR